MLQDKAENEQIEARLVQRAEELFREGHNCCECMIKSSIEVLGLDLPENVYLMGKFFREGVAGSGCICGALAGGVMMLGFISGEEKGGKAMAEDFRNKFIEKFHSSCCRVLRKNQSLMEKLNRSKCREITLFSAALLNNALNQRKDSVK